MPRFRPRKAAWKFVVTAIVAVAVVASKGCSPAEQGSIKLKGDMDSQTKGVNDPLGKAKETVPKKGNSGFGKSIKSRGR